MRCERRFVFLSENSASGTPKKGMTSARWMQDSGLMQNKLMAM